MTTEGDEMANDAQHSQYKKDIAHNLQSAMEKAEGVDAEAIVRALAAVATGEIVMAERLHEHLLLLESRDRAVNSLEREAMSLRHDLDGLIDEIIGADKQSFDD